MHFASNCYYHLRFYKWTYLKMNKSDQVIQLIVNWIVFITSPIWVMPFFIYFTIRDSDVRSVFIDGTKSIFSEN